MSTGRPASLFPLFGELTTLDGIGPKTAKAMARLDIGVPRDLVLTLPTGLIDRRLRPSVSGLELPDVATVEVLVVEHRPASAKGRPYRIFARDAEDELQLVFFHAHADWLRKQLPEGARRIVSGKVERFDGSAQMVHPDHILKPRDADTLPPFEAIYPLTAGVTQRQMQKAVRGALDRLPELDEWLDPTLKARHDWPDWTQALRTCHAPGESGTEAVGRSRHRLAYDELLSHQLTLALARARMKRGSGQRTEGTGLLRAKVLDALPFAPTSAQTRSVGEIATDLASPDRMNRLLQGDVGSGKTLVALLSMLIAVEAGGQAALMAPTEILARQHFSAIAPLVEPAGINLDLITGRDKGQERDHKRDRLKSGETAIAIGTHALFQDGVEFADLRLAIVDEQHRFGVRQRMDLGRKGAATDILVMTATPIPRSLSLAQYGDMDLSILDEKPPGRKPVDTVLVSATRLDEVVSRLRKALDDGRQAYWVCPLVEESETVGLTAVHERAQHLRLALGETRVGLVHGRMPAAEKDAAMADFVAGRTRLLVATTVIEVGVDIPTASIMVIEEAQSFGLSQLHQLRGRVGRGSDASTCVLVYDPPLGDTAEARLKILRETEDGFRIAEEDLRLRGAGDLIGHAQSGLPRFRVADLETQHDLMAIAHDDARMIVQTDPTLVKPRGEALRALLYLMGRDESVRLINIG